MNTCCFHLPVLALISFAFVRCGPSQTAHGPIRPCDQHPGYWQYHGETVLLIGATDNDNLFQNRNIASHLDSLAMAGGSYIRNTMSDRDQGDERAFFRTADGLYDLDRWNDRYWERFENTLQLAQQRKIIVQIEIWDRFDHSREEWLTDPYHPANNINYTYEESGFDSLYPAHPGQNAQPFFFTVPELHNNQLVLTFQQQFVLKLLSIALNYDNILYCIDNETSGSEEWPIYWTDFIRANSLGHALCITQMWDAWDVKSDQHKRTLDYPDRYDFVDISQNSQISGPDNWTNAQYVFQYISDNPRPVNSTKIYGNDAYGPWLERGKTTQHAINTFFRNLIGGFASSRFHRPPHGQGLNPLTISCMQAVRAVEDFVKWWHMTPKMDLIHMDAGVQAYLCRDDAGHILAFVGGPDSIAIDLRTQPGRYQLLRNDLGTNVTWDGNSTISGGDLVRLSSSNVRGSLFLFVRE